jgi:hypothetical protein
MPVEKSIYGMDASRKEVSVVTAQHQACVGYKVVYKSSVQKTALIPTKNPHVETVGTIKNR